MRIWAALAWLAVLTGCATSSALPPAELTSFAAEAQVKRLWRVDAGADIAPELGAFAPALSGDLVIAAGAKGRVSAYRADSGQRVWRVNLKQGLATGVGVDVSQAYVVSQAGELIALSQEDGRELWRTRWPAQVLTAPRADQGKVVLRSVDGRVAAFDALDGSEQWAVNKPVPPLSVRGNGAPMLVTNGLLLGLDNGTVHAMTLDSGRTLWSSTVSQASGRTDVERLVDVDGEIATDEEFAYAVSYQGQAVQISPQRGRVGWTQSLGSVTGLSLDQGELFSSDIDGTVWALSARNGAVKWQQPALARRKLTLPLAVDGDTLVVGDFAGYLHWLSREDGHFVARTRVDSDGFSGGLSVSDGVVFAQGRNGTLAAYQLK